VVSRQNLAGASTPQISLRQDVLGSNDLELGVADQPTLQFVADALRVAAGRRDAAHRVGVEGHAERGVDVGEHAGYRVAVVDDEHARGERRALRDALGDARQLPAVGLHGVVARAERVRRLALARVRDADTAERVDDVGDHRVVALGQSRPDVLGRREARERQRRVRVRDRTAAHAALDGREPALARGLNGRLVAVLVGVPAAERDDAPRRPHADRRLAALPHPVQDVAGGGVVCVPARGSPAHSFRGLASLALPVAGPAADDSHTSAWNRTG